MFSCLTARVSKGSSAKGQRVNIVGMVAIRSAATAQLNSAIVLPKWPSTVNR